MTLVCTKIIISRKKNSEAIPFEFISIIEDSGDLSSEEISSFLKESFSNKCKSIMIFSNSHNDTEDLIDEEIENIGLYDTVTTSHVNEAIEEIASFAKYATSPEGEKFYCLLFGREGSHGIADLIIAIESS